MGGTFDQRFVRVRDAFERGFLEDGELGASVAVMIDGELVVDLHAGHMDKAKTRPWTADTIANVFSVTKAWTSTMAHRLVDQGKLDLDEHVAHYWPEFAVSGKETIRVIDLLDHRAGLPAIRDLLPPEALFDWSAMTTALANETPWWQPGTKHGYHAVTFGWLVGEIIRRVSGKSPGAYFSEEIAIPLGIDAHIGLAEKEDVRCTELRFMKRDSGAGTTFIESLMADPSGMRARAFTNPPSLITRQIEQTRAWRGAQLPAVNGHTNARALARFYGALARDGELDGVRVLEKDSIDRLRVERSRGADAILGIETRFGYGFMLSLPESAFGPNEGAFGHPGLGGSVGFADPKARIGFGYVTNMLGSSMLIDPRAARLISALYASL
jgi:CubicO group peptidase (beta-lactamase class C family)